MRIQIVKYLSLAPVFIELFQWFSCSVLQSLCSPSDCYFFPWRIFNEAYVPHGLKVVQAHAEQGLKGLMDLERRWRQHFLTTMQPRHLPPLWSVDHNHSKFLRKYGENLPIKLNWLSLHKDHKQPQRTGNVFSSAAGLETSTATLFIYQAKLLLKWADEWSPPAGLKCNQHVVAGKLPLWCERCRDECEWTHSICDGRRCFPAPADACTRSDGEILLCFHLNELNELEQRLHL